MTRVINKIKSPIVSLLRSVSDNDSINQQLQLVIKNQYKILSSLNSIPSINEAGFRVYSQFEEDGLLLYVFSIIGFKSKRVVEMCCGTGNECMAANLIINHGFFGYLFDGDLSNIELAKKFFNSKKDCVLYSPKIIEAWITKENVNRLLIEEGAVGEVDLLSLDLDGNDYWIWDSISVINPRVFICEIQNTIPKEFSLTMKYDESSNYQNKVGLKREYRSVSLLAMVKKSNEKHYKLIGANRHGFNLIFLREDLLKLNNISEVSLEKVEDNYWSKHRQEIWPEIKDFDWEIV